MAYGFNSPQGFVPNVPLNGAPLTASFQQLPIKSGYAQNIWTGDLVWYSNTDAGYMANFYQWVAANNGPAGAGSASGNPQLGVFMGCSYQSASDTANPSAPMRSYWPASTNTLNGEPAVGFFIPVNYEYGWSVQCGATAPSQDNVGQYTAIQYSVSGGLVQGNQQTGQSKISVDMSANGDYAVTDDPTTAYTSFLITSLDYSQGASGASVPYGNVIIRLTNPQMPITTNYVN